MANLFSEFQRSLRRYKDLNVKKGIKKQNRSDDMNFIHTNIDDFFVEGAFLKY